VGAGAGGGGLELPDDPATAAAAAAAAAAGGLSDQSIGLLLALSSSIFIGSSFVIKKRGLRRAGTTGVRAGALGAPSAS
jgi:hypothetical protein